MSLSLPDDSSISQYQYRASFPSSDLPTSEPDFDDDDEEGDEYRTPKPPNRNLKRDFTAYSDFDNDLSSFSTSSRALHTGTRHESGRGHYKKRFHESRPPPRLNPATYTLDLARRQIEMAVEESRTSIDLSSMNLTALPNDIEDLNHIVSASQNGGGGTFSVNLELYLTNNRLSTFLKQCSQGKGSVRY